MGAVDVAAQNISSNQTITDNALCHRTHIPVAGPVEYKKPFYVAREGFNQKLPVCSIDTNFVTKPVIRYLMLK